MLAYKSFRIGDPALDARIIAWAEKQFQYQGEGGHAKNLRDWSEAIVETYDGAPAAAQWFADPLASRLKRAGDASLYDEMRIYMPEVDRKRVKQ